MTAPQMQRSVPEILEDIASNLTQIVQAEFRLAKTELKEGAEKLTGPGAAGILIGAGGTKLKRVNFAPDKTIRTLEEDVRWAKQQIK